MSAALLVAVLIASGIAEAQRGGGGRGGGGLAKPPGNSKPSSEAKQSPSATRIMRKSTGRLTPASEAGRLWASARWAYGFWSGTSEDAWQDSAIERVRPGRLFAFASIW